MISNKSLKGLLLAHNPQMEKLWPHQEVVEFLWQLMEMLLLAILRLSLHPRFLRAKPLWWTLNLNLRPKVLHIPPLKQQDKCKKLGLWLPQPMLLLAQPHIRELHLKEELKLLPQPQLESQEELLNLYLLRSNNLWFNNSNWKCNSFLPKRENTSHLRKISCASRLISKERSLKCCFFKQTSKLGMKLIPVSSSP